MQYCKEEEQLLNIFSLFIELNIKLFKFKDFKEVQLLKILFISETEEVLKFPSSKYIND